MMYERSYAYTKRVEGSMAEVEARVGEALATEGFGVLTRIDIQATFKAKIGVERTPYLILGACNPTLANEALGVEAPIGLLLPCNVTIFEGDDGGVHVQVINPDAMFSVVELPEAKALAEEVGVRLRRVIGLL